MHGAQGICRAGVQQSLAVLMVCGFPFGMLVPELADFD